ncbi:MAG: hypothetical protein JSV39_02605 [Candidatus Aenigmatarchaeota archaeon]|nr:MAG: hypothetical protein JSV39_02605 [Candidatus Aenigmarchaeota archaeon]
MKSGLYGILILILIGTVSISGCVHEIEQAENCAEEGEMISIMPTPTGEPGMECCEGLKGDVSYTVIDGECHSEMDVAVCINCPNGECGSGENKCNCPEDCA